MTGKVKELDWDISPYKDLSLNDLSKIINRYRKRLIDLIKLYGEKKSGLTLEYTESTNYTSTDVKLLSKNILNKLGFTNNTLYKKEVEILSGIICEEFDWGSGAGRTYTNEMLASCIVATILNHYEAEYDIFNLINWNNLPLKSFMRLLKKCEKWSNKNYWKK